MKIASKLFELLTGGAAGSAVEYFKQRQQLKHELALEKIRGEVEYEKANTAAWLKLAEHDANWELAQISNSGWKDEFVLLLLSIPLVLVFIPPLQPYVLNGFAVLAQCPDWYRWLVMVIFSAIYGVRIYRRATEKPTAKPAA